MIGSRLTRIRNTDQLGQTIVLCGNVAQMLFDRGCCGVIGQLPHSSRLMAVIGCRQQRRVWWMVDLASR
jgi:hypothetical protein